MNCWATRVGHTLASGLVVAVVLVGCVGSTSSSAKVVHNVIVVPGPGDWPTYGHDAQHTFHGRTTLTTATVKRLKVAWFFPTGDAVTATPTVVAGTVYVGSWDGYFYALNYETGALRWKYQLSAQDAVTPFPGQHPRAVTSDGGLVTSSAWYQVGNATRPNLVIFGGGYTLYALNAATGALYWRHDYTGQPSQSPNSNKDGTRIFSSPVVVGDKVLFGTDVDGQDGYRGYVTAASLDTGKPLWEFQTDVDTAGRVLNNGCGSVWSSGSVLPRLGLVVFDTADCNFSNTQNLSDSILALHIDNGHLAWVYRPPLPGIDCDWDFGGSVNAGVTAHGDTTFLGAGSKDGTYYSLDPATGQLRWKTNVVFGGFSGGFIATTAYRRALCLRFDGPGRLRQIREGDPDFVRPGQSPRYSHAAADGARFQRRHRCRHLAGRQRRLVRTDHCGRRYDFQRAGTRWGRPAGARCGHGRTPRFSRTSRSELVRRGHSGQRRCYWRWIVLHRPAGRRRRRHPLGGAPGRYVNVLRYVTPFWNWMSLWTITTSACESPAPVQPPTTIG